MSCNNRCTSNSNNNCPSKDGCIPGKCPDFVIKRHDTRPSFKVKLEDCDGPLDLTGLVLEASMWAKAKLKSAILATDDYFALADGIGFDQIMVGDTIIMDRVRMPEYMLVIGFDEHNKLVRVERGYHATTAVAWPKGTAMRIMKFSGVTSETEMILQDSLELDGTIVEDQLTDSFLIYNWDTKDTCLPGCYWLEFKLLKMTEETQSLTLSTTDYENISFTDPNLTPADFGCTLGIGVEWARRFPVDAEGFYIKVVESPTKEI